MSFTHFPNLPPELRLRIWDLCLPPPRIVPIFQDFLDFTTSVPAYKTSVPAPITLFICSESRQLTLAHYSPLRIQRLDYGTTTPVYIDYDIGALYLFADNPTQAPDFCKNAFKWLVYDVARKEDWQHKVRHLTIKHRAWNSLMCRSWDRDPAIKSGWLVTLLSRLDRLDLVVEIEENGQRRNLRSEVWSSTDQLRLLELNAKQTVKKWAEYERICRGTEGEWRCPQVRSVMLVQGAEQAWSLEEVEESRR